MPQKKKEKPAKEKEKKGLPKPAPPPMNREQLEALRQKLQKKYH